MNQDATVKAVGSGGSKDELKNMNTTKTPIEHSSWCGVYDQDVCTCRLSDPT